MTASAIKDKQHAPLRTVKVRASASAKQSAAGKNSAKSSATPGTQDKMPIEEMVNKGLDLAEVGIGLGVNIVARLGSILKDQVFDKFNGTDVLNSVMSDSASKQQYAESQSRTEQTPVNSSEQQPTEEQSYYLYNRLSLYPGDSFSLSFSVNNDSLTAEKAIKLTAEPFAGEIHGKQIPTSQLMITPPAISIAVVDFEKFVLTGTVGADLPPDTYHGWIIVTADETYRIPVILNVSVAQQRTPVETATDTVESPTD